MSRGLGHWERRILEVIGEGNVVPLRGATRGETAAILRAGRTLERKGLAVIVRLWNDAHTAVCHCVCKAGTMREGDAIEKVSVRRTQRSGGTTWQGSQRDLAVEIGVSQTTVRRDLARAAKQRRV